MFLFITLYIKKNNSNRALGAREMKIHEVLLEQQRLRIEIMKLKKVGSKILLKKDLI